MIVIHALCPSESEAARWFESAFANTQCRVVDNNNITHDNVYSAIIMTTGHCEGSLGSFDELQNSAQAAVDPQTKPPDLGCESACKLLYSTTTIAIYYYYSARKLIIIYRPTEGRRLS